ncbi:MAG TPA: hypothetical protein VJR27_03465 [Candidatus Saccharimonadales bacterium]|nr:hypothetical protein [Candidatus Saccharimonadales bacterium]
MFEKLTTGLQGWNTAYSERQKLQHTYLALIAVLTVVAGLVSLVSPSAGHRLMYIVLAAVIAFATNAIVWNLLNSGLLAKLSATARRRK